jgi:Domain of unknown function (DUF397)
MARIYNGMPAREIPDWVMPWSGTNGGSCVAVKTLPGGGWAMSQSTDPDGPALVFTAAEVKAFVEGIKTGQADELLS